MSTLASFYAGKRVFVTGHTGFKGTWLSMWLLSMGADVMGYALDPNTQPSIFETLSLDKQMNHRIDDIRDGDRLNAAIHSFRPDLVFHLAAQPIVRLSYQQPKTTFETNIMGTVNLLDSIRSHPAIRAIVNITSDKCYENQNQLWGYRETDPLGGHDPYSSSKACSELVTTAYRCSYFQDTDTAVASARAGNVIGGGDWAPDRLIPDIVRSLSVDKPIRLRNPHATRPWQHVLDALSGYLFLGKALYEDGQAYAQAWNFGPKHDDAISVEAIVQRAIHIWGTGHYEVEQKKQPFEAPQLRLDISKALGSLPWRPRWSIEQSLEKTLQWYRAFFSGGDMESVTRKQIASVLL